MMQKQKAMQMEMIKRQRAIQLAMAKDRLYWFGTFTGTTLLLGVLGSVRKKSPIPLLPMVPLSFLFGYQFDMVYGMFSKSTVERRHFCYGNNALFCRI